MTGRWDCPGSAYRRQHDDRGDGVCAWCGRRIAAPPRVNWRERPAADELHPSIDPVTLEPDEGRVYE